jgi:hypothetical protein
MIFGGNFQEVVQNAILLQLPLWFTEGMIQYASESWSVRSDDALRELFLQEKIGNFAVFAKRYPQLAGQSMFHYISQEYSPSTASNLFYLSRVNRNIESGFLYVFGKNYSLLAAMWFEYYQTRYNNDNEDRKIPSAGELTNTHLHKKSYVPQSQISPNGKWAAYTELRKGIEKIYLHNIADNKQTLVWKGGLKDLAENSHPNHVRLSFSHNSNALLFITNEKNRLHLHKYSIEEKKTGKPIEIKELEFINSFSPKDAQDLVVSAINGNQSDIYLLNSQSGEARQLTRDIYDDFEPTYAKFGNSMGILFASNRPSATLTNPARDSQQFAVSTDIYFYNLDKRKAELVQLTQTPFYNENQPIYINDKHFAYLSDQTGIANRFIGILDSVWSFRKDSAGLVVDSSLEVSANAYANTDYSRSVLMQGATSNGQKVLDMLLHESQYKFFVRDLVLDRSAQPENTQYRKNFNTLYGLSQITKQTTQPLKSEPSSEPKKEVPSVPDFIAEDLKNDSLAKAQKAKKIDIEDYAFGADTTPKPKDTSKIDIDNYLFQSEFGTVQQPNINKKPDTTIRPTILVENPNGTLEAQTPTQPSLPISPKPAFVHRYDPKNKTAYRNLFRADGLSLQVDNTPLFGGWDIYLNNYYKFTPLSYALKTNFSDIFENYRLEIGLRMPLLFNGFDCYAVFEDRKGRLDKKYTFYRRGRVDDFTLADTTSNTFFDAKGRNIKYLAQFELKYPLDKYQSVRGSFAIQSDKIAIIAQEIISLSVPMFIETRAWLRGEYVYDNTVEMSQNIRKGTKFKAYADVFKQVEARTTPKLRLDFSGGFTGNIGFDYRKYMPLDKHTIFAVRASGATSFGKEKILYSLGSMENSVLVKSDTLVALPSDNYIYQTIASPMRGFRSNIRNGNSFFVINAELRIPVMAYFSQLSTRNVFWRSLQLVPFFDIGSAWFGLNPFNPDNPLNSVLIDRSGVGATSPIRVRVNYYRKPIVMCFGVGLRTSYRGFFVKADLGVGVETSQIQTPRINLSLGTDF